MKVFLLIGDPAIILDQIQEIITVMDGRGILVCPQLVMLSIGYHMMPAGWCDGLREIVIRVDALIAMPGSTAICANLIEIATIAKMDVLEDPDAVDQYLKHCEDPDAI